MLGKGWILIFQKTCCLTKVGQLFLLVVEINPQFYWGSGKTEQGYK
jgi:hypothetical protein